MQFNDGFRAFIPGQDVYYLCGKAIHCTTGVYSEILKSITPGILDCIKHPRFYNFQTHTAGEVASNCYFATKARRREEKNFKFRTLCLCVFVASTSFETAPDFLECNQIPHW